jgi:hypothetical protein
MINIAALDPSSLALWFEPSLLARRSDGDLVLEAATNAMFGNDPAVVTRRTESDRIDFVAYVVSSIWHENRHFLDLILTNYGFARIWQFFSVYANALSFMHVLYESGSKVVFPLEVYLDDLRRELMGVSAVPDEFLEIAKDIKEREFYFSLDHTRLPGPSGSLSVGGHAQMEALAFYYQIQSVAHTFGERAAQFANFQVNKSDSNKSRYLWPVWLRKVLNAEVISAKDNFIHIDFASLAPVLIAALASRPRGEDIRIRTLAMRLAAISEYLSWHPGALGDRNWESAWNNINEICVTIFDRTVLEELEDDFELRRNSVHKWEASGVVEPDVIACIWQILALRRALLDILAKYPANIFDPELVAKVTLRHTNALPVWFFPKGVEQLPSGWERLIGWTGEGRKWIWAAIPKPGNWPPASAALAIPDIHPWCNILDQFALLAKLMMKGLRHRTAIGPELRLMRGYLFTNVMSKSNSNPRSIGHRTKLVRALLFLKFSALSRKNAMCAIKRLAPQRLQLCLLGITLYALQNMAHL